MTDRIKKIVIAVLVVITLAVSFIYYNNYQNDLRVKASVIKTSSAALPEIVLDGAISELEQEELEQEELEQEEPERDKTIRVHVAGAVNKPGLYDVPADSRVGDLIELAGGGTESADINAINLAGFITDGQKIYVPGITEALNTVDTVNVELPNEAVEPDIDEGLININSASLSQIMSLPGIGEVLGASIIQYRESNGGYNKVEDIKNVAGIGDKRYAQIKDLITVK